MFLSSAHRVSRPQAPASLLIKRRGTCSSFASPICIPFIATQVLAFQSAMGPTDWAGKDSESSDLSSQQTKHRPRQSPGAACEECRRRKLRCDRKTPQCGVCAASGTVCHFSLSRTERGPKKGNLLQLQQRVGMLHTVNWEIARVSECMA